MKRVSNLVAALALGATVLTGCSGGTDAYCDDLKKASADFEDFEGGDFANFDEFLDRAESLADSAPDELKDDWDTLLEGLNGFVDALAEAGLEPEDIGGLANGDIPEDVDMEKLTEAMTKAQALGSEELEDATDAISKHAKDECGVDLE